MAKRKRRTKGDDKELVQSSVWQHLQNITQPHLLLQASESFLRHLHDFSELFAELRPVLHFLPTPHSSSARSPPVDGSALHRLLENASSGRYVSHKIRAVLSWLTCNISHFRTGNHLRKPEETISLTGLYFFSFFVTFFFNYIKGSAQLPSTWHTPLFDIVNPRWSHRGVL